MEAFGQLAGGVAHDFNNLLTVISGFTEILVESVLADSPDRDSILAIKQASGKAADLTRQLLLFSRRAVLEVQRVDLNTEVKGLERMLRRTIGEDIALSTSLTADVWTIVADPGQIGQVLLNLAVNARDAMPQGGALAIETRNLDVYRPDTQGATDLQPGPYVRLTVSDTGIGMSPDIQARVFEPFFTTKGVGKGTGLGLAVVDGIVRQNKGHVEIVSQVGKGTTFHIYFPKASVEIEAPRAADDTAKVGQGRETILLVEDDDMVRAIARRALEPRGYTILEAANGEAALAALAAHNGDVDLLLTDVVMPDMSGRQLAEVLQGRYPALRVLYTSGYTDDAVLRHGIQRADVAFLAKPYTPGTLRQRVRQVLDQSADTG